MILPLAGLGRTLLHWLLPQTCAHCRGDLPKNHPEPLCAVCRRELIPAEPPWCARCGARVGPERAHCRPCGRRLFVCRMVRGAYEYRGPAASIVRALKFHGRRDALRAAGRWLGESLVRFPELGDRDALVPVPLHRGRLRQRGWNQALLLARGVAAVSGLPVLDVLTRRRATRPLWSLGRGARGRGLAGAFSAAPGACGRRVLLIDDVATTTQTLEECAQALQAAGAADIRALVLARQGLIAGREAFSTTAPPPDPTPRGRPPGGPRPPGGHRREG